MDTDKVEDEYFDELTILNLAFLSCDNRHGVFLIWEIALQTETLNYSVSQYGMVTM